MPRNEPPVVREPSPEAEYNSSHRALLQAFLTHNVLTVDQLKPILAAILTAHDPTRPWTPPDIAPPLLTSTIQTLNSRINPFDLSIRSTRDQTTKTPLYALVNTTSDALTQLATRFAPGEIGYIRRVLDKMFDENITARCELMALRPNEGAQLARPSRRSRISQVNGAAHEGDEGGTSQAVDPGISIAEAEAVLTSLVHSGFLARSQTGYYTLAPRALLELRGYLRSTYNIPGADTDDGLPVVRIRDCEGCKEIVTRGLRCNGEGGKCNIRWHDGCATAFWAGRRGEKKCPGCEGDWTADFFVGERADRRGRGRRDVE